MRTRPKTAESLATNLRALMREFKMTKADLEKKSGVSGRMIGYILSGERSTTIETANELASAFGLTGWQLLVPNLSVELAKLGKLEKLLSNYSKSSEAGRQYIDSVAEKEAKYENKK